MRSVALLALVACARPASQRADGGAPPPDAHASPAIQACEQQLAADWLANPPTTGLGPPASRASYESVIGGLMKKYDVPGGAIALAKDGRLLLAVGLGFEDRPALQPAHVDQLFRLASLSKQLTAAGIVQLAGAGTIDLDAPALSYLTDLTPLPGSSIDPRFSQITVRQLLEHVGGWNRDVEGDPMFRSVEIANAFGVAAPADATLVVRWMLDKTPTYAPGATYCYSNFGYDVLGRVIEHVTGQPYEPWMQAHVLAPAGIADMQIGHTRASLRLDEEAFYDDDPLNGEAPSSVFPDVTGPVPWPYGGWYLEAMDAHGGWIASALDMIRFERSISADETAFMANPLVTTCNTDGSTSPASSTTWYGFGWQANQAGNIWHTGALSGTATEDVITADGYQWVALFDRRPATGDFYGELDADLWTALAGATDLPPTGDLFDDFPDYGPWSPTLDVPAGRSATRVEGRLSSAGAPEYRARLAPRADGTSAAGLDCIDYRTRAAGELAAGRRTTSLQWFEDADGVRRYQASWTP
jgi:N-acyl-D-amino-acid deacylase